MVQCWKLKIPIKSFGIKESNSSLKEESHINITQNLNDLETMIK